MYVGTVLFGSIILIFINVFLFVNYLSSENKFESFLQGGGGGLLVILKKLHQIFTSLCSLLSPNVSSFDILSIHPHIVPTVLAMFLQLSHCSASFGNAPPVLAMLLQLSHHICPTVFAMFLQLLQCSYSFHIVPPALTLFFQFLQFSSSSHIVLSVYTLFLQLSHCLSSFGNATPPLTFFL